MESTQTTKRSDAFVAARLLNQALDTVESVLDGGFEKWIPKRAGYQEEPLKTKFVRRSVLVVSALSVTMLLCASAPGYYSSVGTKGLRTKPYASLGFAGVENGVQSIAAAAAVARVPPASEPITDMSAPPSETIFEQLQKSMPFKKNLLFLLRTIGRGCQFAGTIAFLAGLVAWVRNGFNRKQGFLAISTVVLAFGIPEVIKVLALFSLGVNPFL